MYFILYKITNLINGKIYIGKHITDNIEDGYMGSGLALKRSIKKYGKENFSKEILTFCENSDKLAELEKLVVDEEFIARIDTYNIKLGGDGGWDYVNSSRLNTSKKSKEQLQSYGKNVWENAKNNGTYDILRKRISDSVKILYEDGRPIRGCFEDYKLYLEKANSAESIIKRKETYSKIKHAQGENNSQYGTMWIYNKELQQCKKVPKGSILEEGWEIGRVINWNR